MTVHKLAALLLLAAGVAALWYSAISPDGRVERGSQIVTSNIVTSNVERDVRMLTEKLIYTQQSVADFALKQGALQRQLQEITQRQVGAFYLRCTREGDVVNCVPTLSPVDGR